MQMMEAWCSKHVSPSFLKEMKSLPCAIACAAQRKKLYTCFDVPSTHSSPYSWSTRAVTHAGASGKGRLGAHRMWHRTAPPSACRSLLRGPRRPHRLVVAERHRRPSPARRCLGDAHHRPKMVQPTGVSLAIDQHASSSGANSFGTSLTSATGTWPRPTSQRPVCASEIHTSQLPPSRMRRARVTSAPHAIR